ncbi:MAG: extracellular solute-binding protein [Defluviitaleaceae bacterium]|nr:extracellular solute-binding protein [Defluviitaleaceae bacterium]
MKKFAILSFVTFLVSCGAGEQPAHEQNEHGTSHEHTHNHEHSDSHEHNHEHGHNHNHGGHGHNHDHSNFEWHTHGTEGTINIYSARHFVADEHIFRRFTEETGIGVNVVHAHGGQVIARLAAEGSGTEADLIIADDGAMLSNARSQGLLQIPTAEALQAAGFGTLDLNSNLNLHDPQGYWYALSYRARIIATNDYNIEINSYLDLADERFAGEILLRPGNHMYNISLLASIIELYGFDEALAWAESIVNNIARNPQGNDRDQINAIEAGLGSVALVNTYYLALMQEEGHGEDVYLIFPENTHINISGMAIPRYSNNVSGAIAFMQFALSEYAQNILTNYNNEFSINYVPSFNTAPIDFEALYRNHIYAINIMNIVGW